MFMVKLVEKAANKFGGNLESLKAENVNPRLVFHYGLPFEATKLAYDPIQKIVAISTKNGQIKLLGKDNTQALLESDDLQPSKFLEFIFNEGVILNVTSTNRIEVWNIDRKVLAYVHDFEKEITSFTILQQSSFIFIGDCDGNVTVWKLNQEHHMERMKYWIPCVVSYGNEDASGAGVMFILPQPTAESKRILLIHVDGLLVLWDIRESKSVFTIGGASTQLHSPETKEVTYACWVCPFGSKVAVGYKTGDLCIYTIPSNLHCGNNSSMSKESSNSQVGHIFKINLAYRTDKIPITSLKWVYSDGKSSRLYVMGASDAATTNLVQVILLNGDAESRTIKIGLQLPEPCLDMEIIFGFEDRSKHKHGLLLLVGKSSQMYAYDDHEIEKCLLQFQSKSPPSNPSEVMIKLPFSDSSICSAQFITNNSSIVGSGDRDYISTAKTIPSLIPSESKQLDPSRFIGFGRIKNLYITGHSDGTIKFWDVSCPLLIPLLSITQQITVFQCGVQSEDDSSQTGKAVTAIYYCAESRHLFSGDKSGTVRIYQFKPEPFSAENSFFSLPGSSKKGNNHVIQSVKFLKVNGSALSFSLSNSSSHVAVGSENGHVSVIDIEGPSLLYQKQIGTELSADIISLQFTACNFHGFEKKILVVAARDSSILTFEADTGNTLNSRAVQPKKPFKALFMQAIEVTSTEDATRKQLGLLLCSEKAAYVYSFEHVVQGVKKVWYKKKLQSSCCFASTFWSESNAGLLLLFSCGKIEIRSLPHLSLVKETTLKSFVHPPSMNGTFDHFICSSLDGDVIMVRGDQTIAVASVLLQNETYSHLDSFAHVYDKNLITSEDALSPRAVPHKEKKGIFGSVFKDVKGVKPSNEVDIAVEDVKVGFVELSTIFSVSNFPGNAENTDNTTLDGDDQLDIDDIDIDDLDEKPRGNNVMGLLNKQKLASKFQSFKGKLKQMTAKNEKAPTPDGPQNEKAEAVDEIKKKYGFSPSNETSVAEMAKTKLAANVKKLQGISLRTTEMEDNARSFSSMAKETLRIVEQQNNVNKS